MNGLSPKAIAAIDKYWAQDLHCDANSFNEELITIAEKPVYNVGEFIYLFRRNKRLHIACSAALVHPVQQALQNYSLFQIFDASFLNSRLANYINLIVGPAYMGYLETIEYQVNDNVRLLTDDDDQALEDLKNRVSALHWEHSGIEKGQPIAGYFIGDELVSVAGYEIWDNSIAHIGIVTRADVRGAGYGRACVSAIADYAIKQNLIAQYRTLYENLPSMAIARALGFHHYGETIYIRAKLAIEISDVIDINITK